MKTLWKRATGSVYFKLWSASLYTVLLLTPQPGPESEIQQAFIFSVAVWLFWAAVSSAIGMGIAYLMAPKPPKPRHAKAVGLEQFDVPTAEEGRAVQVIFGSRYVTGPNIVWYGDFKSEAIVERL